MADMANFIGYIKSTVYPSITSEQRLVVIGGSYAGALSSWFRNKHPELAYASWSRYLPHHYYIFI